MTDESISWIMSSSKGRQFMAELLDLCGAGAIGSMGNYAQDWYSLGRRAVGEDILRRIRDIDGGLIMEYTMMDEHKKRLEEDDDGQ